MNNKYQSSFAISQSHLDSINEVLLQADNRAITELLDIVAKYGTPEEINRKAEQAHQMESLLKRVAEKNSAYLKDITWLQSQKDQGTFIKKDDFRRAVLGIKAELPQFDEDKAVTLEVSACQYFPWVISASEQAITQRSLMPGRFIQVRKMKEQEADGDLPAMAAAMQVIGASYVVSLDTKGTDGSNIHLGGAETIAGYFGGIGQPNEHALQWVDEFLYYYTEYGIQQVLNINPGTVFLGFLLYQLGIDIQFKISVFMGNDNPYSALWTFIMAKLFSRPDGTSPLVGFNWSNSTNNQTMEISAQNRQALGFEKTMRFEHHITNTWKHIVRQPYNRRDDLLHLAEHVANISAKHEGGDPEVEQTRSHPSDVLDYFRDKEEIIASGDWDHLSQNFLDKMDAVNKTARALTAQGLFFLAASHLH
ncbi:MAG: hypothetical protein WCI88_00440 [Chloroflexota bacterium]